MARSFFLFSLVFPEGNLQPCVSIWPGKCLVCSCPGGHDSDYSRLNFIVTGVTVTSVTTILLYLDHNIRKKKALLAEVKLNEKQYSEAQLKAKTHQIAKALSGYELVFRGFSVGDK